MSSEEIVDWEKERESHGDGTVLDICWSLKDTSFVEEKLWQT